MDDDVIIMTHSNIISAKPVAADDVDMDDPDMKELMKWAN